ncbi:replication-associated recombination protein A [bacterium BMS3Bbin06]|nr:replication-associated recombination protein A [bacterium BMS3Bbin06]HDO34704.1 replication-associated recombination protein A [Nitrospirota bacterium]
MELFAQHIKSRPLAWRMMPETLDDFVGQDELLGKGSPLRRLIEEDRIVSLILFGPPGTGKTALARIIANLSKSHFISLNAVTAGVKDIRDALAYSRSGRTIVFLDEIHRFNKLQQDALLPHVESGEIILIGASTENPFFALVPALASRSNIFEFKPLHTEEIVRILKNALRSHRGLGEYEITVSGDLLNLIADFSSGDARRALNMLELACYTSVEPEGKKATITRESLEKSLHGNALYYDKEEHYNIVSAFIKSMRGSDPDATVYWLARMIASGEDPMFIVRRIVICASEDVGNADPQALQVAVASMHALEKIGMPEGRIPLAQAAIYVAAAPKSNASYLAIERAMESVTKKPLQRVPDHLKDAHYGGAERLGRGIDYRYPHDYDGHYVQQRYLERDEVFYEPSGEGFEEVLKTRNKKRRKGI